MPRFIFKLQAVLDQRLAREQQQQLVVAQIERERVEAEQDIRAYQQAIELERDELRRVLNDEKAAGDDGAMVPVDLSAARQQAAAAVKLTARAQQAVLKLAGIHRRLDAARLDLLKAATDRKAAELLREKQHEEFKAQQRAKDAAIIDEIGTLKAARRDEDSEAA